MAHDAQNFIKGPQLEPLSVNSRVYSSDVGFLFALTLGLFYKVLTQIKMTVSIDTQVYTDVVMADEDQMTVEK